jgi:hypothetical protein
MVWRRPSGDCLPPLAPGPFERFASSSFLARRSRGRLRVAPRDARKEQRKREVGLYEGATSARGTALGGVVESTEPSLRPMNIVALGAKLGYCCVKGGVCCSTVQ